MDNQKRIKKIFEILKTYPDGISGESISRQIGVSSRTVRSDIKRLQKIIVKYEMTVESAPRKGYTLKYGKFISPDKFIREYFNKKDDKADVAIAPVEYIICRLLSDDYFDVTVTQTRLADELYVSISTLKMYFNKCKKIFEKYNMKIVHYKKNGLKLIGSEYQIRNCICDFIDKSENFRQKVFTGLNVISIDEVISKVLREKKLQIPDTDKISLCHHTAVAVSRAKHGKSICCSVSLVKRIDKTFEYNVAKDILEYMYAVLGIDIAYSEVYYITQCLLTSRKFFNTANSHENMEAKKIVYAIFEKIKKELLINFADDEYLIDGLVLHLNIAINRIQFHMNIRNELLETIKNDYPLAFQMGVIAGKVVENIAKINVNENEIGYIALHFGAALSRKGMTEKSSSIKKVVIACAAGLSIAVLLKAKIEEQFQKRIEVLKVLPAYDIDEKILAKVDYVFTTVPIQHMDSNKIIMINSILKNEDIEKINKIVFNDKNISLSYLKEFLNKEDFFVDKDFINKEECMEFLTENAVKKNLISHRTKESVFERERVSSTAIGNMVAVPHPIYNDGDISFISVLILNKPIMWGTFLVQVVFLLSIKRGDNELWETIFLKLNDYIRYKKGVESMLKNKSYDIFLHEFSDMF
ncbi:BglG family transcription antiterminator [Pectinatus frisingensis]|uniref:BglG family transcription antiterminator n=1 Tax=Pectinatus frisingensis TaxID=865 RepID=UPI0018C6B00E|nr:BglG family transcription antiterminator [Pectinatus frisingensis]